MSAALPGPGFAHEPPADGYAWWYLDALSDDGRHGLTVIAFVGSVFSPYYLRARRRGPTRPSAHAAFNCVLYGDRTSRWVLTERGASALRRTPTSYALGASSFSWDGGAFVVRVDERAAPLPRRVCGEIRITPTALVDTDFTLDADGLHRWRPLAPSAAVEVSFRRPELAWSGRGYVDSNHGRRPLEWDFRRWNWCRSTETAQTTLLYDVTTTAGAQRSLALRYARDGSLERLAPPPAAGLPVTPRWRMPRHTRSEARAAVVATLEDTPFYARSVIATAVGGSRLTAVHESLSLERFTQPWVQYLLPFRMWRLA